MKSVLATPRSTSAKLKTFFGNEANSKKKKVEREEVLVVFAQYYNRRTFCVTLGEVCSFMGFGCVDTIRSVG